MYVSTTEFRAVATQATTTALSDANARDLIERASRFFDLVCGVEPGYFESALYPQWASLFVYIVGDIVTPTTPNNHKYRVTTAGTSGSSEPTWPTSAGATVTNGSVVFTEYGADVIATAQTFYGDNTNFLKLPPYVAGSLDTDITLPEGYTTPTFIERDGYLLLSSNGVMTHRITPFPNPYYSGWYSGVPIIVSAKWGFEETPADVKLAVIELAINLWRETDPANVKLVSIDNQPLRENLPPRVKEIAKRYRVREVAFA